MTCRGSKGQSPLASLGTAPRLAPVHSGLPLCETCLSSAAHCKNRIAMSPCGIFQNKKRLMTVVLWCVGRLRRKAGILPFVEFSIFPEQAFHTPLRCEVSDNHVPYPALHSFSPWLPLSLPDFFLFLFFSFRFTFFLFKSIKIGSHEHLQDFLSEKCHHCHCFLCYFVFMEL